MENINLKFSLRAAFCRIMYCVYLDTSPQEVVNPVGYSRHSLVSKKEKENYKRIQSNLEKLKGLVDEAELWVQKTSDTQERVSKVSISLYDLYRNMSVNQAVLVLKPN